MLRTSHSIQLPRRDRDDTDTTEKMIKRKRIEIQPANGSMVGLAVNLMNLKTAMFQLMKSDIVTQM